MKPTRLNWDTNHGKFIHEYLFYDAVKYVVEYDLGKSGIGYDRLKTIDKVDVDFHKDRKEMIVHYTIEDPDDSQKLIEREYRCEFFTALYNPYNYNDPSKPIFRDIRQIQISGSNRVRDPLTITMVPSVDDTNQYKSYESIPKINYMNPREFNANANFSNRVITAVSFITPDTAPDIITELYFEDAHHNIKKFNFAETVKYAIKNNPDIIANYLVENRDSPTVRDLFKYYHNKFNPSNPVT